jgi:hypothetical protein
MNSKKEYMILLLDLLIEVDLYVLPWFFLILYDPSTFILFGKDVDFNDRSLQFNILVSYIKVYQSARRILALCYMIYNNIATTKTWCDDKELEISITDLKFELGHASLVRA